MSLTFCILSNAFLDVYSLNTVPIILFNLSFLHISLKVFFILEKLFSLLIFSCVSFLKSVNPINTVFLVRSELKISNKLLDTL